MNSSEIIALKRETCGGIYSRFLRKSGFIPAVIYSKEGDNVLLSISDIKIMDLVSDFRFISRVHTLKVYECDDISKIRTSKQNVKEDLLSTLKPVEYNVIFKDAQFDPLSDKLNHLDFADVSGDVSVEMRIPIVIKNKDISHTIKLGASISTLCYSPKLICNIKSVPEEITIDVLNAKVGQIFSLSDIPLPDGCSYKKDVQLIKIVGKRKKNDESSTTQDSAAVATTPTEKPKG